MNWHKLETRKYRFRFKFGRFQIGRRRLDLDLPEEARGIGDFSLGFVLVRWMLL